MRISFPKETIEKVIEFLATRHTYAEVTKLIDELLSEGVVDVETKEPSESLKIVEKEEEQEYDDA